MALQVQRPGTREPRCGAAGGGQPGGGAAGIFRCSSHTAPQRAGTLQPGVSRLGVGVAGGVDGCQAG